MESTEEGWVRTLFSDTAGVGGGGVVSCHGRGSRKGSEHIESDLSFHMLVLAHLPSAAAVHWATMNPVGRGGGGRRRHL